jgi:hypothetical protein
MGTQRVQIKGILPWLVRWACRYCLGCSSWPCAKYFFSSIDTISIPMSPSPSRLGRQPCWVACLSVCVSAVTPCIFLHPFVSYVSISPVLYPFIIFWIHILLVFHYFHFPWKLHKIAPFISAAIFPLICNTVILTFGKLYTPLLRWPPERRIREKKMLWNYIDEGCSKMPVYCRLFEGTFKKTERDKFTGTTFNTKAGMKRIV